MKKITLPPVGMRRCGREFLSNDEFYIQYSERDAARVIGLLPAGAPGSILDFGCGAGRLATGLQLLKFGGEYVGVDIDAKRIEWCRNNLSGPNFNFLLSRANNARYSANPRGINEPLPVSTSHFDVAYAYSVFTHFTPDETSYYLQELGRVLRPGGKVILTAYVEPEVPDFIENPPGYPDTPSQHGTSTLHRARYSQPYFESLLPASLAVEKFTWQTEWNCQSAYYLVRTGEKE